MLLTFSVVVCLLLAAILVPVSRAWAAGGVYAFVCTEIDGQGGALDGYTLVIKNEDTIPDSSKYTVVYSYVKDLSTLTSASTVTHSKGWPWFGTYTDGTTDEYAPSVKRVQVVGNADSFVTLWYASGMFAAFHSCEYFDLTYLNTSVSGRTTNVANMLVNVQNAGNPSVAVRIGALWSSTTLGALGLVRSGVVEAAPDAGITLYREIDGAYELYPAGKIPTGAVATYYTTRPADCYISNDLKDYRVILSASPLPFTGSVPSKGKEMVARMVDDQATLFDESTIVLPTRAYDLNIVRVSDTPDTSSIGDYTVALRLLDNQGYQSGGSQQVSYSITSGSTITLYSDASGQTPLPRTNDSYDVLQLGPSKDIYVQLATSLSGASDTLEMKAAAQPADSAAFIANIEKVTDAGYNDQGGYFTYRITLTGLSGTDEALNLSIWGYVGTNSARNIGIPISLLPVRVGVEASTLELGTGAQAVLEDIEIFDGPTTVPLTYTGRLGTVPDSDVSVSVFKQNVLSDTLQADYDITQGELTVTPVPWEPDGESGHGAYMVTVTVAGEGLQGAAVCDIDVWVKQAPFELTPTTQLSQPVQLKVGQQKTVTFSYPCDNVVLLQFASSDSTVAEILSSSVDSEGKAYSIVIRANAASTDTVTLSWFAAPRTMPVLVGDPPVSQILSDSNYVPSLAFLTVHVSKYDEQMSVTPDELALAVGQSETAAVSFADSNDRTVSVSSSDPSVATAVLNEDKTVLTVTPLAAGTATITLGAEADSMLNESSCTIVVTVTGASTPPLTPPLLSVSPTALTIQAGQTGTAQVSYGGDGVLSPPTSSNSDVATAALNEDKTVLTVTALAAGTATITLSASATDSSPAASCTIAVTVTPAGSGPGKQDPPSLADIDSSYELTVGGAPKVITYEGEAPLQYQATPPNIIGVASSNGGKTLTVSAVAPGTAILTIQAAETATTLALEPVYITFTVKAAAKPVEALQPLSLKVGAKATSEISLSDADGNPISGATINFTGYDGKIIKVSFDAATKKLTIEALAKGETTLTISSDEAAEDYTMRVTVTAATGGSDEPSVELADEMVKAGTTGVKVAGTLKGKNIPEGAQPEVSVRAVAAGHDAYATHLDAKGEGDLFAIHEVVLTINGSEIHDGFGTLTLTFPVDADYGADTVLVRHLHHDGTFTEESARVANGAASIEVTDLSSFALESQDTAKLTSTNTTATKSTTPAKTGDEAPMAVAALGAVAVAAAVASRLSRQRRSDDAEDDPQAPA
ncbi:MAG: Ig-like domain-containing protein [Coriobacteriales bacterium]|nr:Ig-like domain-containing protein [Coriobacteriales bacterium]